MGAGSNLEVSYHREMKQNYLMIAVSEDQSENYECRMLAENTIEGLLKFRVRREDDRCWFCYEITSRQPLERLLERGNLGQEQIRSLLLGITRALMGMGDYLLAESRILLDPGYIYVNPDNFQVGLCLVPGREGNFPREFSELLRFLLGKADHQDREAVVLIYGLYRESLKENYGIDNLMQWLAGKCSPDMEYTKIPTESAKIEKEEETVYVRSENPEEDISVPVGQMLLPFLLVPAAAGILWLWRGWNGIRVYGLLVLGVALVLAAFGSAAVWLRLRKNRNIEGCIKDPIRDPIKDRTDNHFKEDGIKPIYTRESRRSGPAETHPNSWEMVFAEEGEEEEEREKEPVGLDGPTEQSHTTLLWSDETRESNRYLVGVNGTAETIPIAYYPFLIGKQENLTDYVIARDTISRLHVRIDRKDDRYWLTDLNSTNGTAVNGRQLEANEEVLLQAGDRVDMADLHFRFQ